MAKKNKLTIEEVAAIVDGEGLDYAIEAYMSAERIEDDNLRDWWIRAETALSEIRAILAPYSESGE